MDTKQQVLELLKANPVFRERRHKLTFISKQLMEENGITGDPDKLAKIILQAESMSRYWRMILQENKDLRGDDYKDKDLYEQEKQLEYGYTPNYKQDIKAKKLF